MTCLSRVSTFAKKLKLKLFWNPFITLITESYTILIIGCMINSKHLKWNSWSAGANSSAFYIILVMLVTYPVFIIYHLNRYYDQMKSVQF